MLLETYEDRIEELTLLPSGGGRFEVVKDGKLLFSKAALRRHADPNEVIAAVERDIPVAQ